MAVSNCVTETADAKCAEHRERGCLEAQRSGPSGEQTSRMISSAI